MKIIEQNDQNIIDEAVKVLSSGGIMIFPTETAYGVAVDATNKEAVSKLLEYKKRPEGKAISVGVYSKEMAEEYVEVNPQADNIYKEFLPGPVTVISKSKGKVDSRLESEKGTLGIRIPDYQLILEIIRKFGKPITTTSANSASKKTPYSVDDVLENITQKQKDLIDIIIDAGELPKNLTSTVLDTTTDDLKTYREGKFKVKSIHAYGRQGKEEVRSIKSMSVEETVSLGEKFMVENLEELKNKAVVFFLRGDLGAGKTHFTKGVAKTLGVNQTIKSPTYTYVNEYKIALADIDELQHKQTGDLYHVDAWRIETKDDLESLNFTSWIKQGNVIVIEWPEIVINLVGREIFGSAKVIDIEFENKGGEVRSIIVEN